MKAENSVPGSVLEQLFQEPEQFEREQAPRVSSTISPSGPAPAQQDGVQPPVKFGIDAMCDTAGGWTVSCCAGTGPEGRFTSDTLGVRSRSNCSGSSSNW